MFYAQYCHYGIDTASVGDTLYRFEHEGARDHWVAHDPAIYNDGNEKRDVLTYKQARRWYPNAFRKDARWDWHGYWDEPDMYGASQWIGRPTGGLYRDIQ